MVPQRSESQAIRSMNLSGRNRIIYPLGRVLLAQPIRLVANANANALTSVVWTDVHPSMTTTVTAVDGRVPVAGETVIEEYIVSLPSS